MGISQKAVALTTLAEVANVEAQVATVNAHVVNAGAARLHVIAARRLKMSAVPSFRAPTSKGSEQPRRLLAVGGAAVIMVVSVGGALGLVPGVSARQPSSVLAGDERLAPTDAEQSLNADGGAETGTTSTSDGWLTVEDAPTVGSDTDPAVDGSETDDPEVDGSDTDPEGDGSDTDPEGEPANRAESYSLPAGSGEGERIVYDISEQHTWLVSADNTVVRDYPVSGGRDESLLDPGSYAVYSKSRHAVSFDLRETMNYMVRFSHGDSAPIGFHDVPALEGGRLIQTRDELGVPRSAGCIRQWITDARALWQFSDIGTTVVVKA
ncbi:MAG: L,D-transpeptidase [Nocardioidaceae bacterium]|nr:L,D-transpeptidase [Nocardioidaceae bacterium]